MRVHLLGTGGADGVPSFFAASELSSRARELGGKDIRTRSGAVIDETLKIDFGPDTYAQAVAQDVVPALWRNLVITHSHYDHLDAGLLQYCLPPFVPEGTEPPKVFGNGAVGKALHAAVGDAIPFRAIESFVTFSVESHAITPIRAYHKLDEDSLNLIIEGGGKTLLYACDTGVYQQDTWEFIKGTRFDGIVIECTDGFNPSDYWGHLSCAEVVGVIERMRELACVDDTTRVITSHHAASGLATHAELCEFFAPRGIEVGFDGLRFEL